MGGPGRRWHGHVTRSASNFFSSCVRRRRLKVFAGKPAPTVAERDSGAADFADWSRILSDERQNTVESLPVMQSDDRLDWWYGGGHTFAHGAEMIHAKLELPDHEIDWFLSFCGFFVLARAQHRFHAQQRALRGA